LLRRDRAGAEDERVTFLTFILLRVNVELLDIDPILVDELGGLGCCHAVGRRTIFEVKVQPPIQQTANSIDLVNHHFGNVGIGDARERYRLRLLSDNSHFDALF
jgi:hypothetical protein